MKIEFSREVKYVPDFNKNKELPENEQLIVNIKVMSLGDLLDLMDVLKQANFEKGDVKDLTPGQMKTIVTQAGKYIPKYCKLEHAEGFSVEDLAQFAVFMPLATEVLFTLLNSSSPNADDAKN